jgi:hypothetical protein
VARVTTAANALVKAGFVQADAAQTIRNAERSISDRHLVCGPLCADVRQFPAHPLVDAAREASRALVIKDGDSSSA